MIATELHWDFDTIDKLPWPYVTDLLNHWGVEPPLSKLANLYLKAKGFTMTKDSKPTELEEQMVRRHQAIPENLPPHLQSFMKEVASRGRPKR